MWKLTISERTTVPLIKAEKPWEAFTLGYGTVLHIGKKWHLWYESMDQNYRDDADRYFCYATSDDGAHWDRPNLGLFSYDGETDNNILFFGPGFIGPGGLTGATVFLDEKAAAPERFKVVFSSKVGSEWQVFGGVSPDGLHWKMGDKPLLARNSDTQTVCIPEEDHYRLYVRMWSGGLFAGCRMLGYCESATFGDFSAPELVMRPDDQDPRDLQFYGPSTAKLSRDLYVMFPQGYYTGEDVVRCHAALSRDGKIFQRVGRAPLIDLGKGFDSKCIYVSPGAIPTPQPGAYWIYYLGWAVKHNETQPGKMPYGGGFGRFLLTVST